MSDAGRNAGITGVIDVYTAAAGVNASPLPLVNLFVLSYEDDTDAPPVDVTGRGDTFKAFEQLDDGGAGVVSGRCPLGAYPVPAALKGLAGSLKLTFDALRGATKTIPIRIHHAGFSKKKDADSGAPLLSVAFVATGPATWAGFPGTQPAAADPPAPGRKLLWEGTGRTDDPNDLQAAAADRWRARGIADTDDGEWDALADFIAAALSPRAGLKLRTVTFARSDSAAGFITAAWAKNDTADDVLNPRTTSTVTPDALGNAATSAAINAVPSNPGIANTVLVGTKTEKLDDGHDVFTASYAPRTDATAIEQDGSVVVTDPAGLEGSRTVKIVHATASPPADPTPGSGLLIDKKKVQGLDGTYSATVYELARTSSADRATFPKTQTSVDPNAVRSRRTLAALYATGGSAPADPSLGTGEKVVDHVDVPYDHFQTLRIWTVGRGDSADDVTLPHVTTVTDPNGLAGSAGKAALYAGGGAAPSDPGAPAGLKLVESQDLALPFDASHLVRVWRYGPRDSLDEITMQARVTDDPSGVARRGNVITVQTSAAPATAPAAPLAGTVYRTVTTKEIKDGYWEQDYQYGMTTPAGEITHGASKGQSDFSGLLTRAFTAALNTTPAAGTGQLRFVHSQEIDDSNTLYVVETGPRTTIQDITFPGSFLNKDAGRLDSRQETTEIVGTGGNGTATALLAELQAVGTVRRQETPNYDRVTTVFDTLTPTQKRTFPNLKTLVDPSAVRNWEVKAQVVDTTAAATTAAPATPAGLKFAYRDTQQLTPTNGTAAGQTLVLFHYGKADTGDQATLPHVGSLVDGNALTSATTKAALWDTTGSAPADPGAPSGQTLVDYRDVTLPENATLQVRVWRYGVRSTVDDVEMPRTTARRDAVANFGRTRTTVLSCTAAATTEDLADTEWAAAMAATATAATIDYVEVTKLTPTSYERKTVALASGAVLTIEDTLGTWRMVQARLAGGVVQVYVPTVVSKGGTQKLAIVQPTRLLRVTATVRVRRRLMTDAAGLPVSGPAAAIGTTNGATAFGFPTGTLTFVGRRIHDDNLGIAAAHPVWVEDVLLYQSDGQFDEAGIVMGPIWTNAAVSQGWNAASLFGAAWAAAAFPTASYAGFFA